MKKIAILLILPLFLLSLSACSSVESSDSNQDGQNAANSANNPAQSASSGSDEDAADSSYGALSPLQSANANNNGTQSVDISSYGDEQSAVNHPLEDDTDLNASENGIIDIKEKMFATQINEIYLNAEDYLGKTLRYQGMFQYQLWPDTNVVYCYVVRNGPGCCGTDSNPGFEVVWDGDSPKADDWVEATGVLEAYKEDGYDYLRVRLSSLDVMDVRGEETVYQ
ncbi:MAG: DUF1980 domain-containing protein [Clostridiales Family XIII bacterium]|jgi:uncharacterized membrane protein YcgQ (UPF0703/DUF1980 family)|nr:DUF1980 domain-containing protein [Clostridiales Family XIII bacterium]